MESTWKITIIQSTNNKYSTESNYKDKSEVKVLL